VLVHWTCSVDVLSTLAMSTPWLPKLSVDALLITHEDVTVICTVKVEVVVAALDAFANGRKNSVAKANFSFGLLKIG
jgi:hypothetical protein